MNNEDSGKDSLSIFQLMQDYNPHKLRIAEDNIPVQWNINDEYLGLYQVKEVLGKGGMGIVHKVWHKIWKMDIAVKSPLEKIINTDSGLESFIREANTWVELGLHPHIVSCYYVRVLGKIPRVFVEYIDGGSLKDWISDGRLYEGGKEKALERIFDIAIQSARGLDYAHSRKLVHKDIKPANIMISKDGLVKVTDFGIAGVKAILSSGDSFRSDGQSVYIGNAGYTPEYCSPEQASGKSITRMTDIWSWGLCILEMFTGERTWSSGIAAEMALDDYLSNNDERQNLENRKPPMPDKLTSLLKKCFQQEPSDRPENMKTIENELTSIYCQITGRDYTRKKIQEIELKADELNNRAISYLDLGREDKAIECWKDALKADVHHLESTFNYGYFRWQKAEITGDDLVIQMDAIKLAHQNNPDYWLSFGWIHYERGDADAINEIQNTENRITDEKFLKGLKYKERPIGKRKFEGHTEWVNSVCFSPDGRCILSGSGEFGGKDNTLRLWEVQTVKEIRKFKGHSNWIKSSCFSPDGRFVLSGSGDNTLRLWAINAGKEIKKFKGHTADVTSVCFSLDGMYVLSGSEDKTIRLWDVSTCEEIRKYEGHTDVVNSVCISPDGRNALSGSKDTTIRLWYIQSGKENRKFEGHTEAINSVCFSPDGRYILSGSKDTTIRLWDIITGKEIRIFEGHTDVVNSVCISPNGRYALSGSGGEYWGKDYSIRLWDIKSGKEIKRFEGHTKCVKSICFSPDGRFVLSGSWDKTIQLWGMYLPEKNFDNNFPILNKINTTSDIITHEEIITEEFNKIKIFLNEKRYTEAYEIIEELQRSSDYERSPDLLCIKHNCCTESGFKRKQIRNGWSKNILAGHTDSVTSVCISSDARYALSASRDKTIRLWDINTVKEIRKFEGHTDAINNVCISPDGRYALTGSNDKTIRMLDIQSGKEIRKFIGHTSYVNSVNFSPDGKYALSGSDDKTIRMWDIESGKEIRRFETGTKFNNSVCISPDGRYALSGSYNKTISLWDIESGKEIRNFSGHTNLVNSVCFSPDGRYVLSGSSDRTIRIWNIESEKEISKFKGHTDGVTSVCFFPDGKFALSGSCDKTIRLWDIESQREIGKFELHTEGVTSVYLSLDGRYAISGSFDKTLRLWEFDWDCEIQFQADWDEGARPYLDNFLILHQPYSEDGVSRIGKPVWNEEDFKRLLNNLKLRGYGGLKPEIIKTKLIKQTDNWDTRKHRLQASEQIKIYEYVKYNVTETIIIGKQEWMSENLSGEHYRNGDTIPQVHDIKEWKMLTIGAWCYYDNNVKNGKTYGKLYNWYAVNDPRGLAPDGWHIPSDAEWSELTDYLGGAQVAGGKLKATKLWNSPNINTANGSGFNAFPGGVRKYGNNFYIGWAGYFWSSSEESNIFAWDRVLASDFSDVLRGFYGKKNGLSVRCIRD